MKTHEFTVIASGLDPLAADYEDRFFEAGCDDATLSFQKGLTIAEFAREAATLSRAILSAIENVRAAGAVVERVEPDYLVSLSDIAERCLLSKQAISLYAQGKRGMGFPPPSAKVTSGHPLWDWYAVADWLHKRTYVERDVVVNARILKEVNAALIAANLPNDGLVHRLEALEASEAAEIMGRAA
jgi:transcriptional regulator with XRE-family HTH domain